MIYSYTRKSVNISVAAQLSVSLFGCWQEKETHAAMVLGRCFETASAAYFRKEDCGAALFKDWEAYRKMKSFDDFLKDDSPTQGGKPITSSPITSI